MVKKSIMLIQVSRSYVHSYCRSSALFASLFTDDEVTHDLSISSHLPNDRFPELTYQSIIFMPYK